MKLLVVTDIFGRTQAVIDFASELSETYEEIEIIEPYDGENHQFENEDEAYRKFNEVCGIRTFSTKLEAILEKQINPVEVIGFSVGATCTWEMTSRKVSQKIRKAMCFYGSKIREKTEISPRCQTTLIFPKFEAGFDLEETIKKIESKENVEIIRTNFLHGFMNKCSINYSESAYDKYLKLLKEKAV